MKVSVVIPARLGSTRLPAKILKDLAGKPVLRHVWERVQQMQRCEEVIVAVDDQAVKEMVESWGGVAMMTDPECCCGTERIVSILEKLTGDFILNVQGDECFVDPALLDQMIEEAEKSDCDIITAVCRIKDQEKLFDENVVKAVVDKNSKALYFSRSPVPFMRDEPRENWLEKHPYWQHLGIYGYKRNVLEDYHALEPSQLEAVEKLEQLRFLEAGYSIFVTEAKGEFLAVDTEADLAKAREQILPRSCVKPGRFRAGI